MSSPVSEGVRKALWKKRFDVLVAVEFYGKILGIQAKRAKTSRKWKNLVNYVSYPFISFCMIYFPFLPEDFQPVYLAEMLGGWGLLITVISQISTKGMEKEVTLVEMFKDVARLRDDVESMWLYVDDANATDQEIRLTHDNLGARLTETQNRLPALKHQQSDLFDECHNLIADDIDTI